MQTRLKIWLTAVLLSVSTACALFIVVVFWAAVISTLNWAEEGFDPKGRWDGFLPLLLKLVTKVVVVQGVVVLLISSVYTLVRGHISLKKAILSIVTLLVIDHKLLIAFAVEPPLALQLLVFPVLSSLLLFVKTKTDNKSASNHSLRV